MAKRFIDTGLFDDAWFMELSKDGKLLWIYAITKCDHAGILELNEKLCRFQTDIKDLAKTTEELGYRLQRVNEQLIFVPAFFKFQYPNFPERRFRAAESAFSRLIELGIDEVKLNTYLSVREQLDKSYSISKGISKGKGKGNIGSHIFKNSPYYDKKIFKAEIDKKYHKFDLDHYHEAAVNYSESQGSKKMYANWLAAIRNWINKDGKNGTAQMAREDQTKIDLV